MVSLLAQPSADDSSRQRLQVSVDARGRKLIIFVPFRYLLAKRAATAEFEANQSRLAQESFASSAEWATLSSALSSKGKTLYDLEASLVADVQAGKFQ